jgi:hypothetical protein
VVARKPETEGREKQVVNFVYSFKENTNHENKKDTQAALINLHYMCTLQSDVSKITHHGKYRASA